MSEPVSNEVKGVRSQFLDLLDAPVETPACAQFDRDVIPILSFSNFSIGLLILSGQWKPPTTLSDL